MTTAAMVVGLVPLLLGHGAGAASRFSIGVVVVVGMLVGTAFTLFVLPTVYSVLAKDHHAAAHSKRAKELAEADAPADHPEERNGHADILHARRDGVPVLAD